MCDPYRTVDAYLFCQLLSWQLCDQCLKQTQLQLSERLRIGCVPYTHCNILDSAYPLCPSCQTLTKKSKVTNQYGRTHYTYYSIHKSILVFELYEKKKHVSISPDTGTRKQKGRPRSTLDNAANIILSPYLFPSLSFSLLFRLFPPLRVGNRTL